MRERPHIMCRRKGDTLVPASSLDSEMLQGFTASSELEVTVKQRRSSPQNRAYWKMLHRCVEATDIAPTAARLHELLKCELGYVVPVKMLDGSRAYWPDSTAFSEMTQSEFNDYFTRAAAKLHEVTGVDPMAFLTEQAA